MFKTLCWLLSILMLIVFTTKDVRGVVAEDGLDCTECIYLDIEALALNIYHEARGSTYEDKVAVAEVTMNRVKSNRYPNTVREVVYQYKQFSWTFLLTDQRPRDIDCWQSSLEIARMVYKSKKNKMVGPEVLHYVGHHIVDEKEWTRHFKVRLKIGGHTYLS